MVMSILVTKTHQPNLLLTTWFPSICCHFLFLISHHYPDRKEKYKPKHSM